LVDLTATISGGTKPYFVSWITGDQNVGLGLSWNHTYTAAGTYFVEVWVNDSTVSYATNQSWFGTLNVTVTPSPPPAGPFGLHGSTGWILVGGLTGLILLAVFYGILTRNRSPRLPRPEAWMVPDPERSGRSPVDPSVPPKTPPST
jgi:hypothetical protein